MLIRPDELLYCPAGIVIRTDELVYRLNDIIL